MDINTERGDKPGTPHRHREAPVMAKNELVNEN